MKYLLTFVVCIIAFAACQQPGSKKSGASNKDSAYTVSGKIEGLDSGWVYLMHRQSESETPDSARVSDGSFSFTGSTLSPEFCLLGTVNKGQKEYRLGFFVEKGHINIIGKRDSVSNALVLGSPTQDEYKAFITGRKTLDEESEKLSKLYEDASQKKDKRLTDSLEKVFEGFEKKQKNFIKDYTRQHPASYVAAQQVYENFSYNPDAKELDTIYSTFDHSIQDSYFGKKIKTALDIAKKTDIGQPAPAFTMNDKDGKPISLASFKGKYVLVDFWASWCGPCRRENPNVVKAYHEYHSKGFDILSVSLDETKDKWTEVIKKDNLDWTHVSDLKGWQNSAAQLYGVQGIPMNYLVDKNGNIVGKGLRGEDLEKKLAEVVK